MLSRVTFEIEVFTIKMLLPDSPLVRVWFWDHELLSCRRKTLDQKFVLEDNNFPGVAPTAGITVNQMGASRFF